MPTCAACVSESADYRVGHYEETLPRQVQRASLLQEAKNIVILELKSVLYNIFGPWRCFYGCQLVYLREHSQHCNVYSGVVVEQLNIAARVLDSLGIALFSVSSFSVGVCEVGFPSFTRPLHVKLAKLRVDLDQRQLPKVLHEK